jgi:hypothetical protein
VKTTLAAAVLCFVFSSQPAFSQEKSFWNKLSLEVFEGGYKLPDALLGMDKSIVEHPNNLIGNIRGLRGNYKLNGYWLLGATWLKTTANGYGAWARSDTAEMFAANGVSGIVSGNTDMNLNGVTLDIERRFFDVKSSLRPYIRGGFGAGELTVDFRGKFIGHETMSGYDFPVEEGANDKVKKAIPLISAELGLRFILPKNLSFTMAVFWNTGYGTLIGMGWRF